MRRPTLALVASIGLLVVLALPALQINIENPALEQVSSDDPFREGSLIAASLVGPGGLGPVEVVVSPAAGQADRAVGDATVARVRAALASDPMIAAAGAPRAAQSGAVLIPATLRGDPSLGPARATVERLRRSLPLAAGAGGAVLVGGDTAVLRDFDHLIGTSLWKIALFVLVLSFLVMLITLRSVILPIKAVVMTMFSVAASYGILVALFQWDWISVFGVDTGPYVDTIVPPLVLVIAFGLSMDYAVFLLTRIRERYLATGDTRQAVSEGLASTGRTITSAALIMVVVFLSFVASGLPAVQRIGIGLACAVAIDATLVRLVVVPAAMVLLDEWNWWLPRPLRRLLPSPMPPPAAREGYPSQPLA
jgi:RND superfamily putative drug exporter